MTGAAPLTHSHVAPIRTARFARAIRFAHSFARSLTFKLMGKGKCDLRIKTENHVVRNRSAFTLLHRLLIRYLLFHSYCFSSYIPIHSSRSNLRSNLRSYSRSHTRSHTRSHARSHARSLIRTLSVFRLKNYRDSARSLT